MVGVVADDPHEDYQRQACFHHSAEGATAITASGLLLLDTTQAPACPASDPPGHKQQQQLAAQPPADASHPGQQPKQPCHPPASQPQLHTCYILAPASLLTPFLILDPPTCMQTHTESALTRCHLSDDATAFVTLSSSYVLGLLSRMHGGSSCSTCSCGSIHPTPAGGCNESHNALSSAAAAPPPVAYCPPYQPSLHHATQLLTLPATLVGLVTPPACADALSSALQDVRAGSGRGWRYGWGCGSSGSSGAPGMSVAGPSAWGRWGGVDDLHATLALLQLQLPLPQPQRQQPLQRSGAHSHATAATASGRIQVLASAAVMPRPPPLALAMLGHDPSTLYSRPCPSLHPTSPCPYPGMPVSLVAAPFGVLAPHHFAYSVLVGIVSNSLHAPPHFPPLHQRRQQPRDPAAAHAHPHDCSGCSEPAAFLLDARCQPGCEGAPILACYSHAPAPPPHPQQQQQQQLVGLLASPLLRETDGVEVQVALAWPAVWRAAWPCLLLLQAEEAQRRPQQGGGVAPRMKQPVRMLLNSVSSVNSANSVSSACPSPPGGQAWLPAAAAPAALCAAPASASRTPSAGHCLLGPPAHAGAQLQLPPTSATLPAAAASPPPAAASLPLLLVRQGVVMVRARGQWASGVLLTTSGLLVTNSHVVHDRPAAQLARHDGSSAGSSSGATPTPAIQIQVRVPGSSPGSFAWLPAQCLHCFTNHLDLAVLQLLLPPRQAADPAASGSLLAAPLRPLALAPDSSLLAGAAVVVLGHGLFGPGVGWAASATAGNILKVGGHGRWGHDPHGGWACRGSE